MEFSPTRYIQSICKMQVAYFHYNHSLSIPLIKEIFSLELFTEKANLFYLKTLLSNLKHHNNSKLKHHKNTMCIARKNRGEGVVWDCKVLCGIDMLFHA